MEKNSPEKNSAEIQRILGSMPKHTVSEKFNDKLFLELGIDGGKKSRFKIVPFLTNKVFVSSAAASILIIFSVLYYVLSINDVSPNYNDLLTQIDAGDQVLTYIEIPAYKNQTPVEDDKLNRTLKQNKDGQQQTVRDGGAVEAKSRDLQINTNSEKSGIGAPENAQSTEQYTAPMQKSQRVLRIVADSANSKQDSVKTRIK